MVTQIGIVAGEILELLEQRNEVLVYGEFHFTLKGSRDLVLMGLGWLLHEGYVHIIEDPLRTIYQDNDRKKAYTSEAFMFDLVVGNNVARASSKRIKDIPNHMSAVADKILNLLESCGDLVDLRTIECNVNEHRDIVLMSLGWLIRERHVLVTAANQEIYVFQLPKYKEGSKIELFSHA